MVLSVLKGNRQKGPFGGLVVKGFHIFNLGPATHVVIWVFLKPDQVPNRQNFAQPILLYHSKDERIILVGVVSIVDHVQSSKEAISFGCCRSG